MTKTVISIAIILACVALSFVSAIDEEWEDFVRTHRKVYSSHLDVRYRQAVFASNLYFIKKFNEQNATILGYTLGINDMADMTTAEILATRLGYRGNESDIIYKYHRKSSQVHPEQLPDRVDWRDQKCVSSVKDQEQCGSCWSFATTAAIESHYCIKTGKLYNLSEQQMVDCAPNFGCNGGLPPLAYEYIKWTGGQELDTDYPYKAQSGECASNKTKYVVKISDFERTRFQSEPHLQDALANKGPVSVLIDASRKDFHFYKTGIYKPPACGTILLDHVVLAVGYLRDHHDDDYYIVKNSWGISWGQKGYVHMAMNDNNKCGIATLATYPIID